MEDMGNQLLHEGGKLPVGKNLPSNFVQHQPELRTRCARKCDHQRAKCEDPAISGQQFQLVRNIRAKYGIIDEDIYNFEETSFNGYDLAGVEFIISDGYNKAKLAQLGITVNG